MPSCPTFAAQHPFYSYLCSEEPTYSETEKEEIMMNTMLIGGLGAPEIILLVLLVLLLFGGRKIPELARGLGKGIREFNNAKASIEEEIREGSRLELDEKKIEKRKA